MNKILILLSAIYILAAVYVAGWAGLVVFFAFCTIVFITAKILKIRTVLDVKAEFIKYWCECLIAIAGSLILPYLAYLKSESDFEMALVFAVMVFPSTFFIGYLWLRGVNKVFLVVKSKITGTNQWGRRR